MFFGLRFRLLLLVLLACAPLVGLTLHTASKERRREVAAWRRTGRAAHAGCAPRRSPVAETDPPTAAGGVGVFRRAFGQRRRLQEVTGGALGQLPRAMPISVSLTPTVEVVASALPARPARQPGRPSSCRPGSLDARFATGGYLTGLAKGKPTVTFGCPVFDASEHRSSRGGCLDRAGLVHAARVCAIHEYAQGCELGRDQPQRKRSSCDIPPVWPPSGQPFPDRALVNTALSQPDGIVEAPDSQGIPSFYAFAPLG